MKNLIELQILDAIKKLLSGRVNELIDEFDIFIPKIEFGNYSGFGVITPVISLEGCDSSEKERIIQIEAYFVNILFSFNVPESEYYCYAYAAAIGKAIAENQTLGGIVDRVAVVGKKYIAPKKSGCGEGWKLEMRLRVTVVNQVTGNS